MGMMQVVPSLQVNAGYEYDHGDLGAEVTADLGGVSDENVSSSNASNE